LAKSWTEWILIIPPVKKIQKKIKTKYEDATKTKYVAGLMDKAIAKVNQIQNELY
jgi:hypothetical protein